MARTPIHPGEILAENGRRTAFTLADTIFDARIARISWEVFP
jgi:hypothetical protein